MRPIYPSDLDAVTRALLACDPAHRQGLALRIVAQAEIADRYRKRLDKLHPEFGAGTLSSAAQAYPRRPRPDYCHPVYLDCMATLLAVLTTRDAHNPG